MNKYIITFGSSQLPDYMVNPNNVLLVIEAENEIEARKIIFNHELIGSRFCSSYEYSEKFIEEMKSYSYKTKIYSLKDLEKLRR